MHALRAGRRAFRSRRFATRLHRRAARPSEAGRCNIPVTARMTSGGPDGTFYKLRCSGPRSALPPSLCQRPPGARERSLMGSGACWGSTLRAPLQPGKARGTQSPWSASRLWSRARCGRLLPFVSPLKAHSSLGPVVVLLVPARRFTAAWRLLSDDVPPQPDELCSWPGAEGLPCPLPPPGPFAGVP